MPDPCKKISPKPRFATFCIILHTNGQTDTNTFNILITGGNCHYSTDHGDWEKIYWLNC